MDSHDRAKGVLLGLAAGDLNGGPIRMSLCLCTSLLVEEKFDTCSVATQYARWYAAEGFDTGPTASATLQFLIDEYPGLTGEGKALPSEDDIHSASERTHTLLRGQTAGCNAAHRCAPLAMLRALPDDALAHCAASDAAITHLHPLAAEAAAATALLCRALIRSGDWAAALARTRRARPWAPEILAALDAPPAATAAAAAAAGLSDGGFAPAALRAAVAFGGGAAFDATLAASLQFAGRANYCPVLVGCLAGARWGAAAVPPGALAHAMARGVRDRVAAAAEQMAAGWAAAGASEPGAAAVGAPGPGGAGPVLTG